MTEEDCMEKEEMDSLFEGMVLFNAGAGDGDGNGDVDVDVDRGAGDASAPSPSPSIPLDENLFSDLTLITAQDEPPSHLPLRQNSTRRRKKTALRIGYGRDRDYAAADDDDDDDPPQSHPHTHLNQQKLEPEEDSRDGKNNNSRDNLSSHTPPISSNEIPVELKFDRIRATIADKLKLAQEAVISVSALRKQSIRSRRKALEEFNGASTRHTELEKKLDEACEAEDFETAERLSENLASADKEKQHLLTQLRDVESYSDTIAIKMQEALDSLIQVEEESVYLLRRFSEEAASYADSVLMNAEAILSKDSVEWSSSVEAIEVSKFELEIQSQLVQDAKHVLNESIDHSVEDDRREVNVLCKRKEVLAEELRKLLALVKEKEAEIAENDALIQKVEYSIDGVVSCFKEVQASIYNNYDKLQSHLSELTAENEVLLKKKKDIDSYHAQQESRGEKIKNISRISADEANMYEEVVGLRKSLAMFILKSKAYRVNLAKSEERISEEVQILKQEIFAARSSLQELSSTKSSIQQEVESRKHRLLFIDRRIPGLEAEKKVAAATRNFKEAARLAAEAKALCIEKEEIQRKMDSNDSELRKLEEEICQTIDRMQETEVQVSSKEKELAMARFQRLILIARAARAERSAALELGDHEEAEALMAEADAAEVEARKLQPIYNFNEEEIENLPELFISSELVSTLGHKQLAELAASANIVAS
ncbi:hypothetical protein CQW23_25343 [Capsicum baccatum]|uniref:UVR domain-containing protein n=1 Tax=Capsicum baccatum TaxID=33114 RepID=A0A2G2VKR8_CAPBA|nr:hypothetical protein CQW23_25343 [Capsicum baccatum]